MNNQDFFVSAIVPVYNGEQFLADAIQNILNQNYQPLEIIVVDDGSTDRTAEVAARYNDRIHYVCQPNSGPSAARNRGLQMAKGNVIAFLDADDLWSNNKLDFQVSYLAAHPSVEIVQGLIQQMQLSQLENHENLVFQESYTPYNFVNLGSAIYRKSVFDKIGVFDETLSYGEDTDWFIRAWENGVSKVVLDEVALFYRKHQDNMTLGKNLVELGFVRIFKKHLDRCRQRGISPTSSLPGMLNINEYLGTPPGTSKVG